MLLLISSNLVDDAALNAITFITFNPFIGSGWVAPYQRKDVPLPTQDCCCHRIEIITDGPEDRRVSAVVSELSSSRLFQIQLANVEVFDHLVETVSDRITECGKKYSVVEYTVAGGANAKTNLFYTTEAWQGAAEALRRIIELFHDEESDRAVMPSRAAAVDQSHSSSEEQQAASEQFVRAFQAFNPAFAHLAI